MSSRSSHARLLACALALAAAVPASHLAMAQGVPAAAPAAGAASSPTAPPEAMQRPGVAPGTFIGPESTVVGEGGVIKGSPSADPGGAGKDNDYPTVARADYVFACMQVNGQSRDILEKCSCSIDVIATLLPYEKYEEAETIISVSQRGGKAMGIWEAAGPKEMVKDLKRAQVEGELRCF